MTGSSTESARRKWLPEMEGASARRYARLRGSAAQLGEYRRQAAQLATSTPDGAAVLEVAPGPGYFAIELAKLGRFEVTGLDVSATFVSLARELARREGVTAEFLQGDVATMPFEDGRFDLVVCQAAFKNFADPLGALGEMHRVLGRGGEAMIIDMRKDATNDAIDAQVAAMKLSRVDGWITGFIFRHTLRDRAYDEADFRRMAAASPFGACEVSQDPLALQVWLRKEDPRQAL